MCGKTLTPKRIWSMLLTAPYLSHPVCIVSFIHPPTERIFAEYANKAIQEAKQKSGNYPINDKHPQVFLIPIDLPPYNFPPSCGVPTVPLLPLAPKPTYLA